MSGAICIICLEEARPIYEDLQSVFPCGHVFHAPCLQQWVEHSSVCPICRKSCTRQNVHLLYFSDSTQPQGSPSGNLQTAGNDPEQVDNAPALRKLKSQLGAAKTALQSRNEQLEELGSQVAANLQMAERAEAAKMVAKRELAQCKQGLTKIQEELKCCSNERVILQEKNQAMAKDLAAHKLIGDTDLGEEEIFRLASLGNGSNKNAIIETLTKSLILRNKSYKELMVRCNELGMRENRAVRKLEKRTEHLKKTKARVQELEQRTEEKYNACLRGLNRGSLKSQAEDLPSAQRPFNQAGVKRINAPRTPPDQPVSASTRSRGGDIASPQGKVPDSMFKLPGFEEDLDALSRAELLEVQLPKIVRERGQMGVEHVQPACPKKVNTSEEIPCSRKRGRSEGAIVLDHREDNLASRTGFSNWKIKSKHLLQKIELLNRSGRRLDQEVISEHPISVPSGIVQVSLPRPGPTSRLIENRSSIVASLTACKGQPVLNPSGVEYQVGTQRCSVISENSGHGNSSLAASVNNFGAFARKASSDRLSTSNSTFIVSGADGRGGRVTVLKPPSLSQGGVPIFASQKMKRPKTSGAGFRGTQGSLQIEHFFGRTKS